MQTTTTSTAQTQPTRWSWRSRLAVLVVVCVSLMGLPFTGSASAQAGTGNILMVVGSMTPGGLAPVNDRPIVHLLGNAGYNVSLVDDDQVSLASVGANDVVLLSASVTSGTIGDLFVDLAKPVVTWESFLHRQFGFTTSSRGLTQGTSKSISIADSNHPIAAGTSGNVAISTASWKIAIGDVVPSAQVVATANSIPSVFAFETGAALTQGTAPARRVGLFMATQTGATLTQAGADIMLAATQWALAGNSTGTPLSIAFVSRTASVASSDRPMFNRFVANGATVTAVDDDALLNDFTDFDLIFVSTSVIIDKVGHRFVNSPVPLITTEQYLLRDMNMAAWPIGSRNRRNITMVAPGHPLAASLSGSVQISQDALGIGYAQPGPGAQIIATAGGDATYFAYEAGAEMIDGDTAPARRIAFPASWRSGWQATDDYFELLDAAVAWATSSGAPVQPDPAQVERVLHISVDGLRSDHVTADLMPVLHGLLSDGASTLNARTTFDKTQTLSNHTSQLTSRPVVGPSGHGVIFNTDNGNTVHDAAGEYVPSIFDVVHDRGGATAFLVGKSKFDFHERSWNASNGAADRVGPNNGRNKIDLFKNAAPDTLVDDAIDAMSESGLDAQFTFFHIRWPDGAGHLHGWSSQQYDAAVETTDEVIGDLMAGILADPDLADSTAIIVTADHGGPDAGLSHATATYPNNYIVPFIVWGPGVAQGANLYDLNPTSRDSPGMSRPNNDSFPQPVRTGEMANVALSLLDMPSVPGSTHNVDQSLNVTGS